MSEESDKKAPLVSVIIPSYNHSPYIQASIRSVIAQDYKNIELIIIDDGSTDESVNKIRALIPECTERFSRFRFCSRGNVGLAGTLNEALDWCEGEFFSPLASDDVMLPGKTTLLTKYLLRHGKCAAAFGGSQYINASSSVLPRRLSQCRKHTFRDLVMLQSLPAAPAGLIRRELVLNCGKYDAGIQIEDWYMWLKLTSSGEYYLQSLPNIVINYRLHSDNTISKFRLMNEQRKKVLHHFQSFEEYDVALSNVIYLGALSIANEEYAYPILQLKYMSHIKVWRRIYVVVKALTPKSLIKAMRLLKR